ncbi:MAG: hypothetical protein IT438_01985 [Phycisphaerales bacterium]|nr:hypothetical protein [Phycisphaerales bacterium]
MSRYGLALFIASLAVANPVSAQPESPPPATQPDQQGTPITSRFTAPEGGFTVSLTPRGEYAFSADIKTSPGSVSVARASLDAEFNLNVNQRLGFSLGLIPEVSWYNFKNASGLVPGTDEPIDDAYRVDIVPGARYALSQDWVLVGGGLIQFAGEAEADIGDSVTYGGYFGARYRFNERFATTFGIVGKTQLEDSAIFLPLFGLDWSITDTLTLSSSATGLKLANKLDDRWTVWLSGAYESRDFRLDDDNPLPNGVLRDRRVPVKVGFDWTPCSGAVVTLEGGAIVWQEFKIDDESSDTLSEDNTKPAPFVGVSVQLKF